MIHRVEFAISYRYAADGPGVSVAIELGWGSATRRLIAQVDTGASCCLFERQRAEALGIDVESGEPSSVWTAAGALRTFGHNVEIESLGLRFEAFVHFFAEGFVRRNLLGRTGWLDRIRFGLIDYEQTVFLSPYDTAYPERR